MRTPALPLLDKLAQVLKKQTDYSFNVTVTHHPSAYFFLSFSVVYLAMLWWSMVHFWPPTLIDALYIYIFFFHSGTVFVHFAEEEVDVWLRTAVIRVVFSRFLCPFSDRRCPSTTRRCPSRHRRCPSTDRRCPSRHRRCPSRHRPKLGRSFLHLNRDACAGATVIC